MLFIERHEPEAFWVEVEIDLADWSVTVLSNNQFGNIFELSVIGLVVARSVNKGHNVGVLLE